MQRSTVRIRKEDLERIRDLASSMGISQERCVARILQMVEADKDSGELELVKEPLNDGDIMTELKKIKRLLYRIIRALCPLTKEDADDPEFGISLDDIYLDMNRHPEKYGKENEKNDGNNNHD